VFNLSAYKHPPKVDTQAIADMANAQTLVEVQAEVTAHLKTISDLKAESLALTGERDTLKSDLAKAIEAGTAQEQKAAAAQVTIDELTAKLATFEKEVAAKATAQLAAVGVPPVEQGKEAGTAGNAVEQYQALVKDGKHIEAAQFWKKNEAAILAVSKGK